MEPMPKNIARAHFASEQTGKKSKPVDRLSQESSEALDAGLSYGKYKAKQYETAGRKPTPYTPKEEPDPRLKYDRVCRVCGCKFKSMTNHREYCSQRCADKQYRKFAKERKDGTRNGTGTNPEI